MRPMNPTIPYPMTSSERLDEVARLLDEQADLLGRLAKATEDVGGDALAVGRRRAADADPHAAIIVPDVRRDRAQPVMPGHPAAGLHPHLGGRQIDLVVNHHDVAHRHLVEVRGLRHGSARVVHVGLGLQQQDALAGAGQGAMLGLFFGLLFSLFFEGPDFLGVVVYGLIVGTVFGTVFGAVGQAAQGGRRDFASVRGMQAERYEIQVEHDQSARAKQMLAYPWFKHAKWQKEIQEMVRTGQKFELEALSRRGISFITEEYLPKKLKDGDWLE